MQQLSRNTVAYISLGLLAVFTVLGFWFGTPKPTEDMNFTDLLSTFFSDPKTRSIFLAITIDVVTGIAAALHLHTFDLQRSATFYASNIMPYVLGYLLVWSLALLGLDTLLPQMWQEALASIGSGVIVSALGGSIMDNVSRLRAPVVDTDVKDAGAGVI